MGSSLSNLSQTNQDLNESHKPMIDKENGIINKQLITAVTQEMQNTVFSGNIVSSKTETLGYVCKPCIAF